MKCKYFEEAGVNLPLCPLTEAAARAVNPSNDDSTSKYGQLNSLFSCSMFPAAAAQRIAPLRDVSIALRPDRLIKTAALNINVDATNPHNI